MHSLKYQNRPDIGHYLGGKIGLEVLNSDTFGAIDLILPVPLHPKKKRKRGYNQSAAFGAGLSEKMAIPCEEKVLFRTVKYQFTDSKR
jgi:predicted amidophosphoribosyltransferase